MRKIKNWTNIGYLPGNNQYGGAHITSGMMTWKHKDWSVSFLFKVDNAVPPWRFLN